MYLYVPISPLWFLRSSATGYEEGKPGTISYHLLKRKGKLIQKSPVLAFNVQVPFKSVLLCFY